MESEGKKIGVDPGGGETGTTRAEVPNDDSGVMKAVMVANSRWGRWGMKIE